MATQLCTCSILKDANEVLKTTLAEVLFENVKLKIENEKFRQLISESGLSLDSEPSECSATNSVGEDDDNDVIGDDDEDGIELKMVDGVFHMEDGYSLASPCEDETVSPNEDDKYDLDRPGDDDQSQELHDSTRFLNGSWKCAACQKKIRGDRRGRLRHIVSHKRLKVSCPFEGCKKQLNPWNLRFTHIRHCYKRTHEQLSEAQKEYLRSGQANHVTEAKKFEREFFPMANICEVFKLKNEICKKCGAKVTTWKGQRDHVAAHLNLKLVCPVTECSKQYDRLPLIYRHLQQVHAQVTMSQEMQKEWDEAKKVYHRAVAEAIDAHF